MHRRSFLAALSAFISAPTVFTATRRAIPPSPDRAIVAPPLSIAEPFGNRIFYKGVYDPTTVHPQWFAEDEKH